MALTPVSAPTLAGSPLTSRRGAILALVAAGSVILTSTAGRIVSAPGVAGWYRTLAKPSFNPPNWVFPVAWSTLFLLMAVAFWRVLRTPPETRLRSRAIVLFVAQLVVNVGWSVAFFGAHSPLFGLLVIVPFWLLIVVTMVTFAQIDRVAGSLLAPYVAWVAFATVLTATILRMNP
ncbi:MAG: tryptophan-rich sensory protein [Deltaproteobacteria bacterium]|nr:tryptophan-rich sensory protein [Deltaproteobacteria bacterium]